MVRVLELLAALAGVAVMGAALGPLEGIGTDLAQHRALLAVLLLLPPAAVAIGRRRAVALFGAALAGWSLVLAAALPLLLPPPLASTVLPQPMVTSALWGEHEIPLPYEGDGRRLTLPITFEHRGHQRETWMMLDTGATYTTLPRSALAALGIRLAPDAPTLTLHTANGEREARITLVDRVWIGDLPLDNVAIATCEDCAGDEVEGLLGLNVAGHFNLNIDADAREVLFSARADVDRLLDLRPFTEVSASVRRLGEDQGEAFVEVENRSDRAMGRVDVELSCGEAAWTVPVEAIPPGARGAAHRSLGHHTPCERYRVRPQGARW
ncbi:MAG: retropepsin-like domain-containing protein [Deltaproteobacteria bacterium]|nr:retropepsin-like domain-containing protein [Deltaproteobacteria bacterium]